MGSIDTVFATFSNAVQQFIDAGLGSIEDGWDLGTGSL